MASVNIRKNNGYYAVVYNFKTLDEAMQNVYRHFEGRDPPNLPVQPVRPVQSEEDLDIPTLEDTWGNIDTK